MTLRIALVTGEFPPMVGGVGAFSLQLSKALADAGHYVHVITDRRARPENDKRSLWDFREPIDLGYVNLHPRINRWWWSSLPKRNTRSVPIKLCMATAAAKERDPRANSSIIKQ